MTEHQLARWRLILGQNADPNKEVDFDSVEQDAMDKALEDLYGGERKGNLANSSPKINRWLGDIRQYFPSSVVQIMQRDAMERLGLRRMLLEPELLSSLEPDVHLVGTLLSLSKVMPEQTKATARLVVQKVADDLQKRLKQPLQEAIRGSLNRAVRNTRPRPHEINWNRTIRANLKHYQPELGSIIPEQLHGYGKKGESLKKVILLLDQSGSMASSVVFGAVMASIMASIRTLKTHIVAFDTNITDLTSLADDPVEVLFGIQLGGGTDIHKALEYARTLMYSPSDSIVVLISDLYEGTSRQGLLASAQKIKSSGASLICLLALSDEGKPAYDHETARELANLEIPAFACTPDFFPELMAKAIERRLD